MYIKYCFVEYNYLICFKNVYIPGIVVVRKLIQVQICALANDFGFS